MNAFNTPTEMRERLEEGDLSQLLSRQLLRKKGVCMDEEISKLLRCNNFGDDADYEYVSLSKWIMTLNQAKQIIAAAEKQRMSIRIFVDTVLGMFYEKSQTRYLFHKVSFQAEYAKLYLSRPFMNHAKMRNIVLSEYPAMTMRRHRATEIDMPIEAFIEVLIPAVFPNGKKSKASGGEVND